MKPKLHIQKRQGSMNWSGAAAMGAGLLLGGVLSSAPARAVTTADQDCREVADSQLKACQHSAQDDYWIAIAHCDNDPA
jgi:membrane protease subunit (stomatin/prohibitin family)